MRSLGDKIICMAGELPFIYVCVLKRDPKWSNEVKLNCGFVCWVVVVMYVPSG